MLWALLLWLGAQNGIDALVEETVHETRVDGKIGIVLRAEGGETLFERSPEESFMLASNTKLLTTAAALVRLGPDFRFRTVVALEGTSLHVFGGGDPNISGRFHEDDPTAIFKGWAKMLVERKITKLDTLVLHVGLFDKVSLHPDWIAHKYDQDAWWCAPVGVLSLNDNCVDLLYEAGEREGDPVKITLRPDTQYVTLVNQSRTVRGKISKPFGFVRRDGTNEIVAHGELELGRKQETAWIAIQDPTRYFGTVLKETLERAGITVGELRTSDTAQADHPNLDRVATFESDLATSIRVSNTVSQNLYAEMICKMLGVKLGGAGTTEAGVAVIRSFLEKDVGVKGVVQVDGSGLSRRNRASPQALVALLDYMRRHEHGKVFLDSLAVNGVEPGTLRKRMQAFQGAVHAKTGHINGVSALSGYLETTSGRTLIFSILNNDGESGRADKFQDALLERLRSFDGDK